MFLLSIFRAFVFGTKNINEVESSDEIELFRTKKVAVKSGRGTLISFLITPQKVGLLDLKITATSSVGKDLLIKQLLVEPEGDTIYVNKPVFLDLRNSEVGSFVQSKTQLMALRYMLSISKRSGSIAEFPTL